MTAFSVSSPPFPLPCPMPYALSTHNHSRIGECTHEYDRKRHQMAGRQTSGPCLGQTQILSRQRDVSTERVAWPYESRNGRRERIQTHFACHRFFDPVEGFTSDTDTRRRNFHERISLRGSRTGKRCRMLVLERFVPNDLQNPREKSGKVK